MVLTEPDADFRTSAPATKAVKQEDGSWHIDGVKRFITWPTPTTCSRTSCTWCWPAPRGAGPGTKGPVTLFVVPKYLFDPVTGEPGERSGVFVTNVEHKMGLKVRPPAS